VDRRVWRLVIRCPEELDEAALFDEAGSIAASPSR